MINKHPKGCGCSDCARLARLFDFETQVALDISRGRLLKTWLDAPVAALLQNGFDCL